MYFFEIFNFFIPIGISLKLDRKLKTLLLEEPKFSDKLEIPKYFHKEKLTETEYQNLIIFIDKVIGNLEMEKNVPYFNWVVEIIKKNPYCGLSNFNGNCYINCVIQILLSSFHFRNKIFSEKNRFCSQFQKLILEMENNILVNQIFFLKEIYNSYKLQFDIFRKNGLVSSVICSFCEISRNENDIFDLKGSQNLFFKYPIIGIGAKEKMKTRIKMINKNLIDLQNNKILIISGLLSINENTEPIGLKNENIIIHNKKYKLLGIVERIIENHIHMRAYAVRNNRWFLFNDECVTEVEKKNVFEKVHPYFLFYERV